MDHQIEADNEGVEAEERPTSLRRDGGRWLSLYDECASMLASSTLMYAVADLRAKFRKGDMDPSIAEPFMDLPVRVEDVIPVMQENKDLFAKLLKEESEDSYDSESGKYPYLELLLDRHSEASEYRPPRGGDEEPQSDYIVLEMHDEKKEEPVYSVSLNHVLQFIEITFRGSVTPMDFLVDAAPLIKWFPNPVPSTNSHPQDETIGIQAGFSSYLHGKEKGLCTGKSRQIIDSVLSLQKEYPHYRTYVTGHSLGASLATLVAFELATNEETTKPISCIAVASPMVGNVAFRQAFQALEKMGHVRCARVVNYGDVIPLLPTRTFWCLDVCCCCCLTLCAFRQSLRYWHVGARVLLENDGTCSISYERNELTYKQQVQDELSWRGSICVKAQQLFRAGQCGRGDGDFLRNHSCIEYIKRLDGAKEELKRQHLQMFYIRQARSSINVINSHHGPPDLRNNNAVRSGA